MKEAITVKKSAVAIYLKEILLSSLGFIIAFLLAGLVMVLAGMALHALFNAIIPEEHRTMFVLTAIMVCPPVVFGISMMIDDFRKKKSLEEYNERLKWQKERSQMSFEERMQGCRHSCSVRQDRRGDSQ